MDRAFCTWWTGSSSGSRPSDLSAGSVSSSKREDTEGNGDHEPETGEVDLEEPR